MKPRYAVRYLPAAQQDLSDILDYIVHDDPRAARRFVDRIDRAIGRLALFPRSCRWPGDARLQRLGYLVFYVVVRRKVQIRRVLHGARRYDFLLRPED